VHPRVFPRAAAPGVGLRRYPRTCVVGVDPRSWIYREPIALGSIPRAVAFWRALSEGIRRPLAIIPDAGKARDENPARCGSSLCMAFRGTLSRRQQDTLDRFTAASPQFAAMRKPAMKFRAILFGTDPARLDTWLAEVKASGPHHIRSFARWLMRDLQAVRNAITEPWSNGQAEEQINKLKTLKRSMYGRASLELLRARLIPIEGLSH
jgi:transposase